MKKILSILILPVLLFGQLQFIPVNVDYAVFQSTDTTAYVEIYISVFQGNLKYKQDENDDYQSSFKNTVSIYSDTTIINKLSHSYINSLQDTSREALKIQQFNQFIDIFKFDLPFGKYKTNIQIVDRKSDLKGDFVFDLNLEQPKEKLSFSSIELCSMVSKDTATSLYSKNGLKVIPHPRRTYDILSPVLYYYVELYGLDDKAAQNRTYSTNYFVTNSKNDTIKQGKVKTKNTISSSVVDISGFNAMSLHNGDYLLHINATDKSNGKQAHITTRFMVRKTYKNKEQTNEGNISLSKIDQVYMALEPGELEFEFKIAQYIATSKEKRIFKGIDDENSMKLFLTRFWRSRDKEENLPRGSARRIYLDRVSLANAKYGGGRVHGNGWKTDRGRVLITYGKPDEIERHANETGSQPYDVWLYYSLEGGAQFIFGDVNGFGEYDLLHSTYRKELQNPDWRLLINKTRNNGQGSSSFDNNY